MAHDNQKNAPAANPEPPSHRELLALSNKMGLESLNPALREKIEQIGAQVLEDSRATVRSRYALGLNVREVQEDAHGERRFGEDAMKKLSYALRWCKSLLYEALQVVRVYTLEEAERISQTKMACGRLVSYSHIAQLATVMDKGKRDELLRRVVEEDLPCADLGREIMTLEGDGKRNKRGGQPRPPRNFNEALRQQTVAVDNFLNRSEKAWGGENSLDNLALDLKGSDHTEEKVQALKEHAERLRRLAREANERADEAEKAYQRLQRRLTKERELAAAQKRRELEEAGITVTAKPDEDDVIPTVSDPGDNHPFESVGGDAAQPFTLEATDEAFIEGDVEDDVDDATEEPAHQDDRCLALSV